MAAGRRRRPEIAGPIAEAFVRIRADTRGLQREVQTGVKGAIVGAAKTAAGIAGVYGGFRFFEAAIKDAAEEEKALRAVEVAAKNAKQSFDFLSGGLENTLSNMEEMRGFSLPEISQGLVRLISATGSSKKAWADLGIAMDISRARHMQLAQASVILARVEGGSDTALRRLGIIIPKVTKNVDELTHRHDAAVAAGAKFTASQKQAYAQSLANAQALDKEATRLNLRAELQRRFGGQAAAFADTAAGQYERLREATRNVSEEIGKALLPSLGTAAETLREWVHQLRTSESFSHGLHDTVEGIGNVFQAAGSAIRTAEPALRLFANTAKSVGSVAGAGGILALVAGYKAASIAISAAEKIQGRYAATVQASAAGETASADATAAAVASQNALTAAVVRSTEALAAQTTALRIQATTAGTTTAAVGATVATTAALAGAATSLGKSGETAARSAGTATAALEAEAVAAGATAGAFTRLGTGAASFIGWQTAVLAGAAALAFGIYKLVTRDTEWERANESLVGSLQRLSAASSNLHDTEKRLGDLHVEIPILRDSVATARLAAERDKAAFANTRAAKGSREYRELQVQARTSQDNLTAAIHSYRRALGDLSDAEDKRKQQRKEEHEASQKARQDLFDAEALQRRLIRAQVDTARASALQGGKAIAQAVALGARQTATAKAVGEFATSVNKAAKAVEDEHPKLAANIKALGAYAAVIERIPTRKETEFILKIGIVAPESVGAGALESPQRAAVAAAREAAQETAKDVEVTTTTVVRAIDHSAQIARHMRAYGKSIHDSVTSAAGDIETAQQTLADTITAGQQSVTDAITGAKTNLNSLGSSLADAINNYLDKIKGKTSGTAKVSQAIADEAKKLRAEIASGTASPEEVRRAKELQSMLEARASKQGESGDDALEKRKEAVKRTLADLTDLYNKGAISRAQFDKRITKLLKDEGVTRKKILKEEGVAAADAYSAALAGVRAQAEALREKGAPRAAGTGLAAQIVSPLKALQEAEKANLEARKNLSEAENRLREAEIEEQKKLTAELKRFRQELRGKDLAKGATGGKAVGGPIHGPAGIDRVPAMLTPGEIVLNQRQQQNLRGMIGFRGGGPEQLFQHVAGFQTGGVPREGHFQQGGVVGSPLARQNQLQDIARQPPAVALRALAVLAAADARNQRTQRQAEQRMPHGPAWFAAQVIGHGADEILHMPQGYAALSKALVRDPVGTGRAVATGTYHSLGETIHHPLRQLAAEPLVFAGNVGLAFPALRAGAAGVRMAGRSFDAEQTAYLRQTLASERGGTAGPEERAALRGRRARRQTFEEIEQEYRARGLGGAEARRAARNEMKERQRVALIRPMTSGMAGRIAAREWQLQQHTRAKFLPPDVKSEADLAAKMRFLDSKLREGLPFAKHWYSDSSKALLRAGGGAVGRAEKYAALAAIFSPQQAVIPNIGLALRAARQWARDRKVTVGQDWQQHAAELALSGRDWRTAVSEDALKIRSFFGNLMEGISPRRAHELGYTGDETTNDGWIAALYGYGTKSARESGEVLSTKNVSITPSQYAFITRTTQDLASRYGVDPMQAQAGLWVPAKAAADRFLAAKYAGGGLGRQQALRRAGSSFAEGLRRPEHMVRLAFEAASSEKPWQKGLTQEQFIEYTARVGERLAAQVRKTTGLPARLTDRGFGYWINERGELEINPAGAIDIAIGSRERLKRPGEIITETAKGDISAQKLATGPAALRLPRDERAFISEIASASAAGLKQEGVGFLRPISGAEAESNATAWRVRLGRKLQPAETRSLDAALDRRQFYLSPTGDGFLIARSAPHRQLERKGADKRRAYERARKRAASAVNAAFGDGAWDRFGSEGRLTRLVAHGGLETPGHLVQTAAGRVGRFDPWQDFVHSLAGSVEEVDAHYREIAAKNPRHFAQGGVAGALALQGGGVADGFHHRGDNTPLYHNFTRAQRAGLQLIRAYEDHPYAPVKQFGPKFNWHNLGKLLEYSTGIDPAVVRQRLRGNFATLGPGGRPIAAGEVVGGTAIGGPLRGEAAEWLRGGSKLMSDMVGVGNTPRLRQLRPGVTKLPRDAEMFMEREGGEALGNAHAEAVRTPAFYFPDRQALVMGNRGWIHKDLAEAMQFRFHLPKRMQFDPADPFNDDWLDNLFGAAKQIEYWEKGGMRGASFMRDLPPHWTLPGFMEPTDDVISLLQKTHNVEVLHAGGTIPARGAADVARGVKRGAIVAAGTPSTYRITSPDYGPGRAFLDVRKFLETTEIKGATEGAHRHDYFIDNVHVETSLRNQGIGKQMYIAAAKEASRRGGALYSSPFRTSPAAEMVWGSLLRDGIARRARVPGTGLEGYRFVSDTAARKPRGFAGGGVAGFAHGGVTTGGIFTDAPVPLGRVRGYPITHAGRRDYRWLDNDQTRIPLVPNIDRFADMHRGRGVSLAASKLGADWWKKHWPVQQQFATGGVAGGDSADTRRAMELVRAYQNLPTEGGRLGPPVPSLGTLGKTALAITGIDPGVVRARWDSLLQKNIGGVFATRGPGGRPTRPGEVTGGPAMAAGPFGKLPKNLANVLGREAEAYLGFWRIARSRMTKRELAVDTAQKLYKQIAEKEAGIAGARARDEVMSAHAAIRAVRSVFPDLQIPRTALYEPAARWNRLFPDSEVIGLGKAVKDPNALFGVRRLAPPPPTPQPSTAFRNEWFVDEVLRVARHQKLLEGPAQRATDAAAEVKRRFPNLQTTKEISAGMQNQPYRTVNLNTLRAGDVFAMKAGGPEYKVVSQGPGDRTRVLRTGRAGDSSLFLKADQNVPVPQGVRFGGRAGLYIQRLLDQELQPLKRTPAQLQEILARKFAEGGAVDAFRDVMRPRGFMSGGLVPGTGMADSVPAMLSPGEIVISRSERGRLESGSEIAARQRERMLAEEKRQTDLLRRIEVNQRRGDPATNKLADAMKRKRRAPVGVEKRAAADLAVIGLGY